ncbi:hypothetical protein MKX01_022548 [Papaver californicum]|nr:hypothetical protein MKX01_022548 [Papaver californicum]
MNDIFSTLFSSSSTNDNKVIDDIDGNLEKFYRDVKIIKEQLDEVEMIYERLQDSHEQSKTVFNSKSIKQLSKAKSIKASLHLIDRANKESLKVPDCGPRSSSDRTRLYVVHGLLMKNKDNMEIFNRFRERIGLDHKDTVERRYFMVTGEKVDKRKIDKLILLNGESKTFMQKVIQEQRRGRVINIIAEIQERHGGVTEMEKNMAVMVEYQEQKLNDIAGHVKRANSYVNIKKYEK